MPEENKTSEGNLPDQKEPEANEYSADATDAEAGEQATSSDTDNSIMREYLFRDMTLQRVAEDQNIAVIVLQSIVRRLTGDPNRKIVSAGVQPSKFTKSRRKAVLDLYGEDTEGNRYNVEFQRDRSGTTYMRAEVHVGLLRSELMKAGMGFDEGPKTEVYFITERPFFSKTEYPDLEGPVIQVYAVPADVDPSGELPDLVKGKPLPSREVVRGWELRWGR